MLHPRSRSVTLDVKRLFAFIAIVCFLIALLKDVGWIFGSANEQAFLIGGFLALSISWLYADVPQAPRTQRPAQEQPQPTQPVDPRSHIGMR